MEPTVFDIASVFIRNIVRILPKDIQWLCSVWFMLNTLINTLKHTQRAFMHACRRECRMKWIVRFNMHHLLICTKLKYVILFSHEWSTQEDRNTWNMSTCIRVQNTKTIMCKVVLSRWTSCSITCQACVLYLGKQNADTLTHIFSRSDKHTSCNF